MIKLSNEVFFSSKLKRLISLLRDIEISCIWLIFFLPLIRARLRKNHFQLSLKEMIIDLDKSSYSFPLPNISLFGVKMNGTKYRTPRSTTTTTCRVSIYKYKKAAEIDEKSIGVSKILRWQPFTIPIVFWQGLIRPRRDLTLLYSNISPD